MKHEAFMCVPCFVLAQLSLYTLFNITSTSTGGDAAIFPHEGERSSSDNNNNNNNNNNNSDNNATRSESTSKRSRCDSAGPEHDVAASAQEDDSSGPTAAAAAAAAAADVKDVKDANDDSVEMGVSEQKSERDIHRTGSKPVPSGPQVQRQNEKDFSFLFFPTVIITNTQAQTCTFMHTHTAFEK